jgi:lipopolysaccharide transport system permease protein
VIELVSTPSATGSATDLRSGAAPPDRQVWVIEPRSLGIVARFREVGRYRGLLSHFVRQTFLGVFRRSPLSWLWLILRSGAPIVVTSFVFGVVAKFPSDSVPYLLFLLVGMTAWNLFEFSLLFATRSMGMYARLLTRVYFPRIILLPISTIEPLVRIAILIGLVLVVAVYFGVTQGRWYLETGPRLLAGVAALLLSWLLAIAFALWTSMIDAPGRDVRYSIRYFLKFWFFLTPVIYPLSMVPEQWRWLIALNPLTGIVEAFRWGILGVGELPLASLGATTALLVVAAVGGLLFFGRAEAKIVDAL